ncbi:NtaA/DmoA family FMN-dependent monooxygenase [Streptomyces sp. NPDC057199]|uniref:NtaA/DmoA family FMN-dependent monooxygenase n=1 Tax=Streptomyces sp. NPDC057199 TaxID=3346047 RepID=UPI003639D059
MTVTPFQLAMITDHKKQAWQADTDRHYGDDFHNGDLFVEQAKALEKARFSYVFLEDFNALSRSYKGSIEPDLIATVHSPKYTVIPLAAKLAAHTKRLGLIVTASTSFYPPYLLARQLASLNALSDGRAGWNIVTSVNDAEAQNYGMDQLPKGPERYERAEEYLQLVDQLFKSWEPDAIVADDKTGVFTDPSKVHEINFEGKYFRSRGPLQSPAGPGGGPVYAQAGASEAGRNFAAKHAEVVFASAGQGVEGMKEYRDDIHRRMKHFGRDPREVKIFYDTDVAILRPGEKQHADWDGPNSPFEFMLALYSFWMNTDLSQFDPDKPFPEDYQNTGISTYLEEMKYLGREKGLTFRQALIYTWNAGAGEATHGTAEEVGEALIETMNEVGGDGIMLRAGWFVNGEAFRRITEELVPYLQRRGATPKEYAGTTLRDNLFGWG